MLKTIIITSSLLLSQLSFAQPWFGPGGGASINPPTNTELCLNSVCTTVFYNLVSWPGTSAGPAPAPVFALAFSTVEGYPIMGYAGPCMADWACPAIYDAAYYSLYDTALIINRHNRF